MKNCGILLHISSLPNNHGIGSLGKNAYKFVDFLETAGQSLWQVLPLGQTSYGDSPYQTFSVNAGNPYFIDIDTLVSEGLLSKSDLVYTYPVGRVDYGELYGKRYELLHKIKMHKLNRQEFSEFCQQNSNWLNDFALFMSLKKHYNDACWDEWDEPHRMRNEDALKEYAYFKAQEIEFFKTLQYLFFKQWRSLKGYANSKGIKIVGDMPIYVAYDSVDVWRSPELFYLDSHRRMVEVAGVPPDYFSADGQLWGNPLYNWSYMAKDGYAWWMNRIAVALDIFDVLRIDHFRGFDSYWAIPAGSVNAKMGKWKRGPALELFEIVNSKMENASIIAEDLGEKSNDVMEMLKGTGYPGMKVLQFGFFSGSDCEHLPHNYTENYIAYTGTHDNATTVGWFNELNKHQQEEIKSIIGKEKVNIAFIKMVYASKAKTAIIPMQDFMGLGNEARFNIPSTLGGNNWCWRLKRMPSVALANRIKALASEYGRSVN